MTTSTSARVLLESQLRRLGGIEWTVVCGDDYDEPPPEIEVAVVPMRRDPAFSDGLSMVRLYRLFRNRRFSFVQTHTPKASLIGLPAARLARSRALYTMHGSLYFAGNSRRRNLAAWIFERWCCSWAHLVLLQSQEDQAALPRARICPTRKLRYIGNGIRLDRFPAAPMPTAEETPIVLMISRLVAEKGCRDFFALAQRLRGQARCVHVGPVEHDQRDAIPKAEVEWARRECGVEFVGSVADVRPYLRAAAVVVLPSYREGIPRAAMEAAATSRPVVAYDIRGVREVIPSTTGLLVPLGDVNAMVRRVRALLAAPGERVELGLACAAAASTFSESDVVGRLAAVYAELRTR